jgi:hypothetical protein
MATFEAAVAEAEDMLRWAGSGPPAGDPD